MFMKAIIASVLAAQTGFAAGADVFCKVEGQVVSATTEQGHYDCAESLAWGAACFTGSAAEVIRMINTGEFSWDEEYLDRARFAGPNSIAYTWVDGPNSIRKKMLIHRCARNAR
ncbi:MAG: hypothetical protein A2X94_10800 [Bdellovibrionales bacterium GWB1_55_8]|nr:MAG: hypothetical protein A2X94_10800 [Bdellovibrionales bacterium GWB1_55_8]